MLNYRRLRRTIERHHMIHMILGWYVISTILPHHAICLPYYDSYLQRWRISCFIPTKWQCYAMLNKKNVKVVINWSTIKIHPNGGLFMGFPTVFPSGDLGSSCMALGQLSLAAAAATPKATTCTHRTGLEPRKKGNFWNHPKMMVQWGIQSTNWVLNSDWPRKVGDLSERQLDLTSKRSITVSICE